jgi:hypothetical protein
VQATGRYGSSAGRTEHKNKSYSNTTETMFVCRQPVGVGVRLGVRRGLGRRHLPLRRRRAAAVRQGERGALLQGTKSMCIAI